MQSSEPLLFWKRAVLRTRIGILHLRLQWLEFYERRAQLRGEAITRRRFRRSIAERERAARSKKSKPARARKIA
jgi:hypothetical protein